MKQKPHERFMMSFSEAARVIGISKRTYENGFRKGLYAEIHVEKHLGGWKANLLDVFHFNIRGCTVTVIGVIPVTHTSLLAV